MIFLDRVPGIPDFISIVDLIREERILSAFLGDISFIAFMLIFNKIRRHGSNSLEFSSGLRIY